jgi:integrase/recombinase XerD
MNPSSSLPEDRKLTLEVASPLLVDHLRLLGRSASTLRSHHYSLRAFGKFWKDRDLREASPEDLETYSHEIRSTRSRETAYLYLAAVRALFRHLVSRDLLLVDPSARLPMPRMTERMTGRILSQEEMKKLVESPLVSIPSGLRDRALLECLYSAGLRISEARELLVGDIGEDALFVRSGKGGKDRTVPLGKEARTWIGRYLGEARPILLAFSPSAQHLWLTRWGKPFRPDLFRKHLGALGKAAGIEGLTGHMIRRSMATHLLQAGASPHEVSGILGHEDLRSLSHYVKVTVRELREAHGRTHPREVKP